MNRVATLATAEKEKAIGEHTSIVQMPPERNEPSCLGGGTYREVVRAKNSKTSPSVAETWRSKRQTSLWIRETRKETLDR